jgi:hypothetical protein
VNVLIRAAQIRKKMTAINPHPLANPYNTCRFGNFNIDRAVYGGYISKTKHPQQLTVP